MENKILNNRIYNKDYPVMVHVNGYPDNANLHVELLRADEEEYGTPFSDTTKNLGTDLPYYCGAFKDYSEGQGMIEFLQSYGIGNPIGVRIESGFVSLPVVQFDRERLRALDPAGCDQYEKRFNKIEPQLRAPWS